MVFSSLSSPIFTWTKDGLVCSSTIWVSDPQLSRSDFFSTSLSFSSSPFSFLFSAWVGINKIRQVWEPSGRHYLYLVHTSPGNTEVLLHQSVGGCEWLHLGLQVVDCGAARENSSVETESRLLPKLIYWTFPATEIINNFKEKNQFYQIDKFEEFYLCWFLLIW